MRKGSECTSRSFIQSNFSSFTESILVVISGSCNWNIGRAADWREAQSPLLLPVWVAYRVLKVKAMNCVEESLQRRNLREPRSSQFLASKLGRQSTNVIPPR